VWHSGGGWGVGVGRGGDGLDGANSGVIPNMDAHDIDFRLLP
jgi:hypothetical protein